MEQLGCYLRNERWEVAYVVGGCSSFEDRLAAEGFEVERAYRPGMGGRVSRRILHTYLRAPLKVSHFRRQIRRMGLDLVHTHAADDFWYLARAARLEGIPCLATVHGIATLDLAHQDQWRNVLYNRMQRWALRNFDRVFFVSEFVRRETEEYHGEPYRSERHRMLRILPLTGGPELPYVRPRVEVGPLRVGVIGRLAGDKRLDVVLRSLHELRRRGESVVFDFYGSGHPECRQRIEEYADLLEVSDCCSWPGWVDLAEVAHLVDVWLVPTSDREAFNLSKIEGMRYGLPVVVLGGGGSAELLSHEHDALVNENKDPFRSAWDLGANALERYGDHVKLAHNLQILNREDPFRLQLAYNGFATAGRLDPVAPMRFIESDYRELVA